MRTILLKILITILWITLPTYGMFTLTENLGWDGMGKTDTKAYLVYLFGTLVIIAGVIFIIIF